MAAQVTVFAAASLMESLKEIGGDYERQTGGKVIFNFAGSSTLARQIEEGAPADVFFSADEAQMYRLEKKNRIVEGSRRNRLSNSLVVIVATKGGPTLHSLNDLARPEIRKVALGDPKSVPVGVYARKYLEKINLWKSIAPKIVPMENVRGALAAVESGNADASIVYMTDALISKNVVVAYHIAPSEVLDIRYPAAIVRGTKNPNAAWGFLEFLDRDAAIKVFENRGFVVIR
jgi:molybdate transport system substrate-binding protein